MTRIDFYVLPSENQDEIPIFACRLAEKAFRNGLHVLIAVDGEQQAQQLDELLWTFREDSFLPHAPQNLDQQAAIEINSGEDPAQHHGLLINLRGEIPTWFSQFDRLAEIVCQHPDSLARSRTRYSHFRDRGYPLQSHKIPN